MAKSRAWALKPSFTFRLFDALTKPKAGISLMEEFEVGAAREFERRLEARFEPFVGETIGDVLEALGVQASASKSYAAAVVWRIFGAKSFKTKIVEFEEMGLTPRITRVGSELIPFEATSFPAFRYRELLEESWEDSDLLSRIEYMLFIPVRGQGRWTPQAYCVLGRPVFWRPTTSDLELIRREWELFRVEIEHGFADRLTPASKTVAIHVRPHAKNRHDTDDAPKLGPIMRKSFWLNKPFVQNILLESEPFSQRRTA
jgi:DNA mismatch repair protein MutH